MYRIIASLVLAICLGTVAGATTTLTADGVWWSEVAEEDRAKIIIAAMDAYQAGWISSTLASSRATPNQWVAEALFFKDSRSESIARFKWRDKYRSAQRLIFPSFSEKTIRAYADGINYFYSSHPKNLSVGIGAVLSCIQDIPVRTCDEVAKDGF